MQTKLLSRDAGTEYALIFEKGDEVVSLLTAFARKEKIPLELMLTRVGALNRTYDPESGLALIAPDA